MNLFEKNLENLSESLSELSLRNIKMASDFSDAYEIEDNDGKIEYYVKSKDNSKISIHSKRYPEKEAERQVSKWLEENENIDDGALIIYGLGGGFQLEQFIKSVEDKTVTIVLVDNSPAFVKQVLNYRDFSFVKKSKNRIQFIISDDISNIQYEFLKVILNMNVYLGKPLIQNYNIPKLIDNKSIVLKEILKVIKACRITITNFFLNSNNMFRYKLSKERFFNSVRNLPLVLGDYNVENSRKYKGKICLCLASGPSLELAMPIIKKHREKFVLIGVNDTLKYVRTHNINLDIIMFADGYKNMVDMVSEEYFLETTLLVSGQTAPEVIKIAQKNLLLHSGNKQPNGVFLDKFGLAPIGIRMLGTSFMGCIDMAVEFEFSKIFILGMDLSWVDKVHVVDVVADGKRDTSIDYFVKGNWGKQVKTNEGYEQFIKLFASYFKDLKNEKRDLEIYNVNNAGAYIENINVIKVNKFEKIIENEKSTVTFSPKQIKKQNKGGVIDLIKYLEKAQNEFKILNNLIQEKMSVAIELLYTGKGLNDINAIFAKMRNPIIRDFISSICIKANMLSEIILIDENTETLTGFYIRLEYLNQINNNLPYLMEMVEQVIIKLKTNDGTPVMDNLTHEEHTLQYYDFIVKCAEEGIFKLKGE